MLVRQRIQAVAKTSMRDQYLDAGSHLARSTRRKILLAAWRSRNVLDT